MKKLVKATLEKLGYQIQRRHPSQISKISVHAVSYKAKEYKFAVDAPSDGVQQFHVRGEVYEAEELDYIEQMFRPGVFVDVGANVGNHSVVMAGSANCKGVIAVEPNPRALLLLRLNIELNQLGSRVRVLPVAFSDRESRFTMHTPSNNLGGTTISPAVRIGQPTVVSGECDSVSGAEALHGVDVSFIKIDVEGHEIEALNGLREVISQNRPDVFIEVGGDGRGRVEAYFGEMGYSLHGEMSRYKNVFNLVFVPGIASETSC